MLALFASDIGSEMMKRFQTTGPQNTLLALDKAHNNSIIGFIEIDPERSIEGECYFLSGLYVLPSYRHKGIASKLVQKILELKCTKGEELIVKAFSEKEKRVWESLMFKVKSTTLSLKK
jgi:GNAT superfamily N-acetyltransferase